MAKGKIQNGQAEYGIIHVQEEEMRAAGQGVFEERSNEVESKAEAESPANKARKAAPTNKGAPKRKAKKGAE